MPTFTDSLMQNPTGKSGIYNPNQGRNNNYDDVLGVVNSLKDREMKDFKDKASFMSDLSLKQDRLAKLYDPEQQRANIAGNAALNQGSPSMQQGGAMNTVMARDPNEMTGYEKGELGVKQQQIGQEQQKLAQTGKLGQEALDVKTAQEKLNQQKSDQINVEKQKELQAKVDKTTNDLSLAHDKLQANINDHEAHIGFLKSKQEADDARHALERAQADAKRDEVKRKDDATIADLQAKRDQQANSKTTTELDANGNKKTVTTQRGSNRPPQRQSNGTYNVVDRMGDEHNIPGEKLDDWMSNHDVSLGSPNQSQEQ